MCGSIIFEGHRTWQYYFRGHSVRRCILREHSVQHFRILSQEVGMCKSEKPKTPKTLRDKSWMGVVIISVQATLRRLHCESLDVYVYSACDCGISTLSTDAFYRINSPLLRSYWEVYIQIVQSYIARGKLTLKLISELYSVCVCVCVYVYLCVTVCISVCVHMLVLCKCVHVHTVNPLLQNHAHVPEMERFSDVSFISEKT